MATHDLVKLFDQTKVRVVWDDEKEQWFFSVVDVVGVLTESVDGRKYWNKLKQRLREEGNESVTNCHQLKLEAADGKKYKTDVADFEQLFRLIQSIPSLLTICHQLTNGRNYLKILIYNIEEPSPCYI